MQWLKEEDNNTNFFHKIANVRRSLNSIHSLLIGEVRVDNKEAIKNHIEEFFRNVYSEERLSRLKMDGLSMSSLGGGQGEWLERPFTEEEMKKAVWSLDGDKAPGPNGFTIAFYNACWDVIQADLMLVMQDFCDRGFLDAGSDATYITLIPKKKKGAEKIADFHPTILVGSTYKIISKCLALYLIKVLLGLVPKEQGAFFKGRNMVDEVLCANEVIDARIKEGRSGVAVKLDLKKAYDLVNWEFLLYVLRRCGFGVRWREWI